MIEELAKALQRVLTGTKYHPVISGDRVELWEMQPDGRSIPSGIFLTQDNMVVEVAYDKRDAVIT